jgi:hypothetical protein
LVPMVSVVVVVVMPVLSKVRLALRCATCEEQWETVILHAHVLPSSTSSKVCQSLAHPLLLMAEKPSPCSVWGHCTCCLLGLETRQAFEGSSEAAQFIGLQHRCPFGFGLRSPGLASVVTCGCLFLFLQWKQFNPKLKLKKYLRLESKTNPRFLT